LVNLFEIASVDQGKKRIQLSNGVELNVSKYKMKDFLDRFVDVHC